MNNKKVLELIKEELKHDLEKNKLMLWDLEFIKEGVSNILRIYIDKQDKNEKIDISDCEIISRRVSAFLDEKDPIQEAYMLEVSSPGINRALKNEYEYNRYIGHIVDVKLYSKFEGEKEHQGELLAFKGDEIHISSNKAEKELIFKLKDIASTRLAVIL
ncbi:MAG: ribosome maturation factor RimP [Defluviitaleaceae bacterium]|nr:ribosome maturation factor RimP [Defluviitaleaceae bacterium]